MKLIQRGPRSEAGVVVSDYLGLAMGLAVLWCTDRLGHPSLVAARS